MIVGYYGKVPACPSMSFDGGSAHRWRSVSRQRRSNCFDDHATCTARCCSTRNLRSPRWYAASSSSDNQTNASRAQFGAPQGMRRSSVRVWFVTV